MHDEASEHYAKEAKGSDSTTGRDGVVKSVLDDLSMTDILSTVARKVDELFNNDPANVTAYQQTNAFYNRMCEYLDKYCEIDKMNVFKGFFVDYSPPNILYVDNSDASTVINIIKNAFSMRAKTFFDKKSLKSVYLSKRGQQSYLSVTPDTNQKTNITLYDLYQIILSILYAAIYFDEGINFYVDSANPKTGKLSNKIARNLFALSLGYDKKDRSTDDRQNRSLGKLVARTKSASNRYKEFLKFEAMDNDSDMPIDSWFAYLQTKMVFVLAPGGSVAFQRSPAFEDQQKTHVDLQIKLVTHHPEIELLKLVSGTRNMVHLMSATGGKITPRAEQFDIEFLAKYGKQHGVNVFMPTFDHHYQIDYAETSLMLQDARLKTRELSVINYEDNNDLFRLVELPASAQMSLVDPDQNLSPKQLVKKHYSDLLGHLERINNNFYKTNQVAYLDSQSPIYEFFKRSVLSIMVAASTQESMLSLSLSAHAVKILKASILDCCQSQNFTAKIKTAIAGNYRKITFNHEVFGRFELPLLNDWLARGCNNPSDQGDIEDHQLKTKLELEWSYLIDFVGYIAKLDPSNNGVMRLALYDSNIAKILPDYKDWFIKDIVTIKGEQYPVFTVLMSYFKIAGTGLNNTVFNTLTGKNEDIQTLFLSAGPFWSVINDTEKNPKAGFYKYAFNGYNKISNSLVRQRQIASNPLRKEVTISEFDSTLSSFESKQKLDFEHSVIIYDAVRQLLGRTEREDCPKGFISKIIVPTSLSLAHAKAAHLLYNFDDKGSPTQNHLDYKLQSLNSRYFLENAQKLLLPSILTKEARSKLTSCTEASAAELSVFSNEFVRDVTIAARAGDKDAVEFSLRYHEANILFNTSAWVQILRDLPWITKRSDAAELRNTIDKIAIHLDVYSNADIELYQTPNNGLTDFYGQNATARAYNPIKICLPEIGANYLYKNSDSRLLSVIKFSNELTTPTSDLYNVPSLKHNTKIVLHPVMLPIALGNMAERLFKRFLDIYQGGYYELPGECFSERYGYQFFELFDFWLNVGGTWVCIDTKNYGQQENLLQTQKIYDRAEDKLDKIIAHTRQASDAGMFSNSLFSEASELHVVYLNMRVKDGAINPQTKADSIINGKKVTVYSHHLNFFQSIQWIDFQNRNERKDNKKKSRQWEITINDKLLQLMNVEPDNRIGTSFKSVVDIDETVENAALARLNAPTNSTTEGSTDDSK